MKEKSKHFFFFFYEKAKNYILEKIKEMEEE